MHKIILVSIVLLLFSVCSAQTKYYVSVTGDNNNSGLNETNGWRTITYAASSSSPVKAGDTVFIQAGNYGSENVAFQISGTASHPITFEGYQTTPGDNPDLNYTFGDSLDTSVMPLLDGGDRAHSGTAITLYSQQYLHLKNIQITNYNDGIDGWNASYCTIDNIIETTFGDYNSSYDGKCISFSTNGDGAGGEGNTIKNSIFSNGSAEGISIAGNNNTIENSKVYCNENYNDAASMDYYIIVSGNNNTVKNCYIERVGNLAHGGHGISLKGNCENNLITGCTSKGMETSGYQLRHRGVKNNTIENSIALNCGFSIRDGASNNTIKNCKSINSTYGAVTFGDSDEDSGAQYSGRHNIFENCIFEKAQGPVINFFYWSLPSVCDSNTFVNCVVDGGAYLFNVDRENSDNTMINCIVSNVQNYYRTQQNQDVSYPLNFSFEYTDFWNNGFSMIQGEGNMAGDPIFVDSVNSDYHLGTGSPCIDKGTSASAPLVDFEGTPRPQGATFDIGAYEYSAVTAISQQGTSKMSKEVLLSQNSLTSMVRVSGELLNSTYKIISPSGAVVQKGVIKTSEINVSGIKSGVYVIVVEAKQLGINIITKLIKR